MPVEAAPPFKNLQDAPLYDLKNIRVLLVDDSPTIVYLFTGMLKAFGMKEIMTCHSGNEAIRLLTLTQANSLNLGSHSIDIVITDWLMGDGSGLDLIKWIRSHKEDSVRFLPILLLSAYTSEKVVATARDSGANGALVKPVSAETLAQRILYLIDSQRPFVKADHYFGPDRRFKNDPFQGDDRRIIAADDIKTRVW
jgi:CheY-like chemotaxis protein